MARLPRCVQGPSIVEIMSRTLNGRHVIKPIEALNDRIHGVLARAIAITGVKVHGWVYLSNHVHLLVSVEDAKQLGAFLQHLNRNVTIAIQQVTGHKGRVWDGRPTVIAVLDDQAAERRLKYLISNGVKEGLVDSPLEWPGASSVRALVHGMTMRVTWVSYDRLRRANRRGAVVDVSRYAESHDLVVTPLPSWEALSPEARSQRARALVDDVIAEAKRSRGGAPALGVDQLREQDPTVPHDIEKTPAPAAHGSSQQQVEEFKAMRRAFTDAYRRSSARFRRGETTVEFPPGAFRPAGEFAPVAPLLRSARAVQSSG